MAFGHWKMSCSMSIAGRNGKSQRDLLRERRDIWRKKPVLRRLYAKWYGQIGRALKQGRTLELGGGSGNMQEFFPDAISTDILFAPWLDAVIDAHALPFRDASLDNIVLFDVLHHLRSPAGFFREAQRALKARGRIVMMEPYVSWLSFPVYRFLHAEGMDWRADPLEKAFRGGKYPFQGNQAIPTLLFERHIARLSTAFPRLRIVSLKRLDALLYPLSGGFHNPSLCPPFLVPLFESIEQFLQPLSRYLSFRLFVVLEKV